MELVHHTLTFPLVLIAKQGPNRAYSKLDGELAKRAAALDGQASNPARTTKIWGSVNTTGAPPAGSK